MRIKPHSDFRTVIQLGPIRQWVKVLEVADFLVRSHTAGILWVSVMLAVFHF